ncbi:MAG: flagellar hook-length control protein FliK [SAR324 cluster bacterium]|nr:flagellar hook-length control protein FliK [SAR324 cluster bacterium]
MIIGSSIPVIPQGIEEIQGLDENSDASIGQGFSFENALFAMQESDAEEGKMFMEDEDQTVEEAPIVINDMKTNPTTIPAALAEVQLKSEESEIEIASVDPVVDHSGSHYLPLGDNTEQLTEQVSNMSQPAKVASSAQGNSNFPSADLKSVVEHVPGEVSNNAEEQVLENFSESLEKQGLREGDKDSAATIDPRISSRGGEAGDTERTKVSIATQLNMANAQQDLEKNGAIEKQMENPTVATPAALMHQTKAETEEDMLQRRLMQQFRSITADSASMEASPSQSLENLTQLREISQTPNFDQAISEGEHPDDFMTKQTGAKSPIERNIPQLADIFKSTEQESVVEDTDTSMDIDPSMDNMSMESIENNHVASTKESNSISALKSSEKTSVVSDFDLDQIMSKVNLKDDGDREVTIQLRPEHLGDLRMKVRQEGNDLTIEMTVRNPEAKGLLEANLAELRTRFLAQDDNAFDQLQFAVNVGEHSFSNPDHSAERGQFEEDYSASKQQERLEPQVAVSQQYKKAGLNSGVSIYA